MGKGEITIYSIAKEAGVSPATVSRVLTKSAPVSPEKRRQVEEVIAKYDYRPSAIARSLIDTRTHTIGIMVADIRNPYYASMVVACEVEAQKRGYTVVLSSLLNDKKLELQHLKKLHSQRVDAIIQLGSSTDDLVINNDFLKEVKRISRTVPFVTTGFLPGIDNCYQISVDAEVGIFLVLDHLIALGHKRIAFVGGRRDVAATNIMRQQFLYTAGQQGLEFYPEYIIDSPYTVEGGYACFSELRSRSSKQATAVVCINDFVAIGFSKAAHEAGLVIPHDLSLVGFDNTYLADFMSPSLTSVDYDYEHYGAILTSVAIGAIDGEDLPRRQNVTPRLVERKSCARAPMQIGDKQS